MCLLVQVSKLLFKSTAPKQTRKHETREHDLTRLLACAGVQAASQASTAPKQTRKHDTRKHETRKHTLRACLLVQVCWLLLKQARRPSRHASMTLRACLLVQACWLLLKSTAPKQTRKHDLTCLLACAGVQAASQARRPSRHTSMTLRACLLVQV